MITDDYIDYIRTVRRYSVRTQEIYRAALDEFFSFAIPDGSGPAQDGEEVPVEDLLAALTPVTLRNYEVHLLDERDEDPRTVNLHLSVLSGFCRYLIHRQMITSNPVRLIRRPKTSKRLPEFYREDAMTEYFARTEHVADEQALTRLQALVAAASPSDKNAVEWYEQRLHRLILSILYGTGIRRSELLGLTVGDIDFRRKTMRVRGKGDKMREIPLIDGLCEEISLYLPSVETMTGVQTTPGRALLLTAKGRPLYPVYVDRVIKSELGESAGISGRKSPHVLRHTLATELLDNGTDLNSIKELLGHASLAATQVYTHNSIEKLKSVYQTAHPRAKRGGNNGH